MSSQPFDYEARIARLRTIISQLQNGQTNLENSIALYEEGTELIRTCRTYLENAEMRVQQAKLKGDGSNEVKFSPFKFA
jgi:exodeoxyribonuclease VII small subunit